MSNRSFPKGSTRNDESSALIRNSPKTPSRRKKRRMDLEIEKMSSSLTVSNGETPVYSLVGSGVDGSTIGGGWSGSRTGAGGSKSGGSGTGFGVSAGFEGSYGVVGGMSDLSFNFCTG